MQTLVAVNSSSLTYTVFKMDNLFYSKICLKWSLNQTETCLYQKTSQFSEYKAQANVKIKTKIFQVWHCEVW
jgi:hypothetical protein